MVSFIASIKRFFHRKPMLTKEAAKEILHHYRGNLTGTWSDVAHVRRQIEGHIAETYQRANVIVSVRKSVLPGKIGFSMSIFTRRCWDYPKQELFTQRVEFSVKRL